MKKRDMILIVILLAISLSGLIFFRKSGTGEAYIYTGGKLYAHYPLSSDSTIHIENDNGIVNDIEIADGTICMKNATCPGKQCMSCGRISRNNESICCAPAGLLIIIRSEEDMPYDAITE